MKRISLTAAIVLILDQLSKYVVVFALNLHEQGNLPVLPPVLNFHMAWNRGVNFGLFASNGDAMRWILVALALAISAWVVAWVLRERLGKLAQLSAGLLVGGALGNVIDRLIHGAVADFLNMSCCGIENPYSFNVADIAVFAGAIGLVLFSGGNKTP